MHVPDFSRLVSRALREDLGHGDVTSEAVVPSALLGSARVLAREPMVLCGLPVFAAVFAAVDPSTVVENVRQDGDRTLGGDEVVATVRGPLRSILTAERTALNFLQRLSGVATLTRQYADRIEGSGVRLVDTRKTTPGLRLAEKYAVRVGGGHNHRFHLADGVMIKDNHIVAAGGITEAVRRAKAEVHHLLNIQVEVESLEEAVEAVEAGARVLLLDNFDPDRLTATVAALRERPEDLVLEASGRVRIDTVQRVSETGVDVISSGGIVHQATWRDLSLEFDPPRKA